MVAQLDTPLGPLTVANTHLSFVPGWNRLQLRRLVRDLRGFAGPRVLMGDLNMTPPTTGAVGRDALARRRRRRSPRTTHTASSTTSSPTIPRCGPTTARLPSCRSRITVRLLWTFRGRDYVGWRRGVRRDLRGVDGPVRGAGRRAAAVGQGGPHRRHIADRRRRRRSDHAGTARRQPGRWQ